ncbi:MAG: ribonuclease R [Bacilli bacterium]|nr:ribonuclease R [Bacilli bacterium]
MEEKILDILKMENRAFSVQEIFDKLGLQSAGELTELMKLLNALENELKVYHTKTDKYMLFNNSNLQLGNMLANKKGFGFVDIEGDKDVYVSAQNMNNAIHGDKVVVEIISRKGFDLEGRVIRIAERTFKQMVGEYYLEDGKGHIKLDDPKVKIGIEIDPSLSLGAVDGHKVLVKIEKKLKDNNYKGRIIKILGHKNDPGVDILSIVNKYGINDEFSEEVIAETEALPFEVQAEEMEGRKDLRQEMIFTIDGPDTKDIDDAISCKKLENGHYELGVHIADVSYYVKSGSKLDDEAMDRGTSVYLADRVIPMLPHTLSNGICSLNPNVDRLAMSCNMEIDEKGNVVDYDIFESVIRSQKQMTYPAVNLILEKNQVTEGYEPFVEKLYIMEEIAKLLRKNKEKRGYIDFDIDEAKIIVDENGEAIDVKVRERGTGEKLIEDFMIAANETVASHIYFMELPFIYRVHGKPNEEKIETFLSFIKTLGYQIHQNIKEITPITMQQILEELKEKKEFHILSSLLLRSMQKAIYDKVNIGHFGLASKCYTHFTSPIRRYPDTTVHRLLRTYLFKNQLDKDTIEYWDNRLVYIAQHSSIKERSSIECEREVNDMKKAEYMMKHIGEEYTGMISSVMSFGFFVELPNLVEGLVRVDDLRDDHYIFEETKYALIGVRTKKGYRLGDTVRIRVKNANKDAKTVDFEVVNEKKKKEKEIEILELD